MDIGCTAQSNNNTPSTAFTIKLIHIVKLTLTITHSNILSAMRNDGGNQVKSEKSEKSE